MCGRFSLEVDKETVLEILRKEFNIEEIEDEKLHLHHNIAPGNKILAVIHDGVRFRAGLLNWGFVPSFATDMKNRFKMINARIETVQEKPSFRESFLNKRCIILADGFYEWKKIKDKGRQPMKIKVKNQDIIFLAALWSSWKKEGQEPYFSITILTTKANETVEPIHNRMPVIIKKDNIQDWLIPQPLPGSLYQKIIRPYTANEMYFYEVNSSLLKG